MSTCVVLFYQKCLLFLNEKLDPCYHRDLEIAQIQQILLRKNKANVLLTGVAGCGKTALVEGLAAQITQRKLDYERDYARKKKAYKALLRSDDVDPDDPMAEFDPPAKPLLCDCVIYDLSLTALVGGTRYRGDFEERLQKIMAECNANPNVVLFIDEVHQLNQIGRSEANDCPAQALKPALARKEMRLIGATTNEEKDYIAKDKALWRRFSEIVVTPLSGQAAEATAVHILEEYCRFHRVVTDADAAELYQAVRRRLPNSVFPDNLINVIDETLASAVFERRYAVGMSQFLQVLDRMENTAK